MSGRSVEPLAAQLQEWRKLDDVLVRSGRVLGFSEVCESDGGHR
jgi:hypothetical protein